MNVYDVLGRLVVSTELTGPGKFETRIDERLPTGTYFVRAIAGYESSSTRFVVTR
jgi:hypothetical protein